MRLWAIAVADFRERVRRPAYAVVLLAAVGLGYLAAPATGSHWTILNAGAYRGVYNSAYVGTVTALAGALWLSACGFYVVRTAIARDESTGVGQLLAATPLSGAGYLVGKFLSNLLLLASMAATLCGTALVMQLARGESAAVDPVALVLPFVLLTVPALAVTAAVAVLFETVPLLRGGLGNVVWFFLAMVALIATQSPTAPLGGIGTQIFAESMRATMIAQGITPTEFSLGLMYLDRPPRTFLWPGADFTAGFVGDRALVVLLAAAVTMLPALWFGRFDPARALMRPPGGRFRIDPARVLVGTPGGQARTDLARVLVGAPGGQARTDLAPAATLLVAYPSIGSVRTAPLRGGGFGRTLLGEVRILRQGVSRWWWLAAATLLVVGLAVPVRAVPAVLLATWIWPVLIWSRLGTQIREHDLETLLGAYPAPGRRLLAEWTAGAVLTAAVGLAPAVRLALAADWPGVAAWGAGVGFIPALALACGVLSRTHRLFQAIYLPLWYAVVNGIAGLDYVGAVPGGPSPLLVGAGAVVLLAAGISVAAVRQSRR
jgi:hypothetical protein